MDAEGWIALVSLLVSAAAILLSWRAHARSKVAARAQLYLELRTRFLEVLENLPLDFRDNPASHLADSEDRAAAERYWHHAFDEWYITNRLDKEVYGHLWQQFYRTAVLAGLKHDGLRNVLVDMTKTSQFWTEFRAELERIWTESHPRDGSRCTGLTCAHSASPAPLTAASH